MAIESKQQFVKFSTCIYPSDGPMTYTYADAAIETTTLHDDHTISHTLKRSKAIFMHEQPELQLAFKVAIEAMHELERKLITVFEQGEADGSI